MKQILILGLACMLVFSSFKKENGVTLTVETQKFDPDLLEIYDFLGESTWLDSRIINEDKFTFNMPIDKPCIMFFTYGSNFKHIFLRPGQSLEISFDAANFDNSLHYSGSLAMENTVFDSVNSQIRNVDMKYLTAFRVDMALSYIDSTMNANNQYFEKLIKGKQTTSVFIEFTKASILYYSTYLKIKILERQKGVKDLSQYTFLNQATIENEKCLDITDYQMFLDYYISMETNKGYAKLDSIAKLSPDAEFNESLKVIGNLKNSNVRDFSLTYTIYSRLQENGIMNFVKDFDYFKKNNRNPSYSEVIRKAYEKKQLLSPGKPAPQFTLSDVDGKKVSLSDFKGKFVFIDFWQTLCPRCSKELPDYLKLYAEYKDENIAFVSISANEDENVWRNYVKEKKNVGYSLRAEKYFSSEVFKAYQVYGIPFFVVIDKEGNIVDQAAAKPSSKEIRETLDHLLK